MSSYNLLTTVQKRTGLKMSMWIARIILALFFILSINTPTMMQGDSFSEDQKEIEKTLDKITPLCPQEYPPAFDWRDVGGYNYVTSVENQLVISHNEQGKLEIRECATCIAFAVVAALEANARIQLQLPVIYEHYDPNYNVRKDIEFEDLSEAQLLLCNIKNCEWGWSLPNALHSCQNPGVLFKSEFEESYPQAVKIIEKWSTEQLKEFDDEYCLRCENNYCKNTIRISGFIPLCSPDQMKKWISSKGPVVTLMYLRPENILEWDGNKIYKCDPDKMKSKNHAVCCIGYDDIKQAWLCKNSLGKGWGDQGYFWVGYKQCGIDEKMYGIVGFIQIPVYKIKSEKED